MAAQMPMPFTHAPSYAPADFVHAESNAEACRMLEDPSQWPQPVMALVGEEGSGKTHYFHWLASRHAHRWIAAAQVGSAPAETLLFAPLLHMLDDAESVRDEAAFAQLINHARATATPLLLAFRTPPSRVAVALADLRSRLNALPIAEFRAPDDALLAHVLAKEFADRQWRVAPEVLQFLLTRLPRRLASIRRFVEEADRHAMAEGRALTLPFARALLQQQEVLDV